VTSMYNFRDVFCKFEISIHMHTKVSSTVRPLQLVAIYCIITTYIVSATIFDFCLSVSFGSVTDSTIEKFDRKNMGVTVGILFLASLEAEIPLGG